jgi:hypothetical protein
VIHAAAPADRLLLERTQAGHRLPGVENLHPGFLDGAHVARGERRHSGQVAEEVERHALGRDDRRGRARYLRHHTRLAPEPLRTVHHEHQLRIDALEDRLRHPQPGDHARRLLGDPRPRLRALGHDGPGGEIALADVLGEGGVDDVRHRAATAPRSIPAAA